MLDFDLVGDAWSLGRVTPSVDSDSFRAGERLVAPADLRIRITTPGKPLDITVLDYVIVVTSSVGELVAELAANDVQRTGHDRRR